MLRNTFTLAVLLDTCSALINECGFPPHQVIQKDVAILGGGASGAFAAVRLREDFDADIVVIEKEHRLGGHANTYYDPTANTSINFGVQGYTPYGPAKVFFRRFSIDTVSSTTTMDLNASTTTVDITNGRNLSDYEPPSANDVTAAMKIWLDIAKKYETEMTPGFWNFFAPGYIPADLLLPFGDFARKHGIEALAPSFAQIANIGVGGFEDISTWQIMAFQFGVPITQAAVHGSFFVPKDEPNTFLYDKIYGLMKDDVMLNSQVVTAERDDNGVRLVVQSKDGSKTLVKAKRLLVSFAPTLHNLESLHLDEQEMSFFDTFTPNWLFTSIVKTNFIPAHTSVDFFSARAVPDNYLAIRDTPYSFWIEAKKVPGSNLFQALLTANYSISQDEAKAMIRENVMKLLSAGTFDAPSSYAPADIEIMACVNHNAVLWRQSPEMAQAGLIQKALALQGHRSTWYTGALWTNSYSADVWALTDTVLPRLMHGIS